MRTHAVEDFMGSIGTIISLVELYQFVAPFLGSAS